MLDKKTDEELILGCQDDINYFIAIADRYKNRLTNFCYRLTGDYELSKEIVYETFITLYDKRKKYKPVTKFITLLLKIAYHHYVSATKWKKKHPSISLEMTNEEVDELKKAIESIPEKYLAPIIMYLFEGISCKEISEIIHIDESLVKEQINYALEKFTKNIEEINTIIKITEVPPDENFTETLLSKISIKKSFLKKLFKFLYKPALAISGAVLFVFFYQNYMIDKYTSNLNTSLNTIGNITSIAEVKEVEPFIRFMLADAVSKEKKDILSILNLEFVHKIISRGKKDEQVKEVQFFLKEELSRKEDKRSNVLKTLDKTVINITKTITSSEPAHTSYKYNEQIKSLTKKAEDIKNTKEKRKEYYRLGYLAMKYGDYERAVKLFENSELKNVFTEFNIAWCKKMMGNYKDAREKLKELTQNVDYKDIGKYEQADTYELEGKFDKAIELYAELSTTTDYKEIDEIAKFNIGYTYLYELNNPVKASEIFKEIENKGSKKIRNYIKENINNRINSALTSYTKSQKIIPELQIPSAPMIVTINFEKKIHRSHANILNDFGEEFDTKRGYGWKLPVDEEYRLKKATWCMKIPNGNYLVTICIGDRQSEQGPQDIWIEEKHIIKAVVSKAGEFIEKKDIPIIINDEEFTLNISGYGNVIQTTKDNKINTTISYIIIKK